MFSQHLSYYNISWLIYFVISACLRGCSNASRSNFKLNLKCLVSLLWLTATFSMIFCRVSPLKLYFCGLPICTRKSLRFSSRLFTANIGKFDPKLYGHTTYIIYLLLRILGISCCLSLIIFLCFRPHRSNSVRLRRYLKMSNVKKQRSRSLYFDGLYLFRYFIFISD